MLLIERIQRRMNRLFWPSARVSILLASSKPTSAAAKLGSWHRDRRPSKQSHTCEGSLTCVKIPNQMRASQTGLETRFGMHGTCQRGDVVLVRNEDGSWGCGEVWLNASVCGVHMSIISIWEFVSFDREGGFAKWKQQDNPELWEPHFIAAVCIHRRYADVCVTLLPAYVR